MAVWLFSFGLFSTIGPALLFFLGLSLVVFVHELGHFLIAKWCDVRVSNFAIGFGPEIFGFTRGETRYSFRVFPLGGYVKMLGQEDFAVDKTGELQVKHDPRSYASKTVGQRMMIVSAGVVMNVIFAAIFFMVAFMIGMEVIPAKVGLVLPDKPGYRAGLRPGDQIVSIDGHNVNEWQDVMMQITLSDPGETLVMRVRNNGVERTVEVEPEYNTSERLRRIGVSAPQSLIVADTGWGNKPDAENENQLRVGDKIIAVRGKEVTDVTQVLTAIAGGEGRPVPITVERELPDGKTKQVNVERSARLVLLPVENPNLLGASPRIRIADVDPQGPAYRAGLRSGDILLEWDGIANPTWSQILENIRKYPNADQRVVVLRDGEAEPQTFLVRPEAPFSMTGRKVARVGIDPPRGEIDEKHLILARVEADSPMGRAGLSAGDRITAVAGEPVGDWYELIRQLKQHHGRTVAIAYETQAGQQKTGELAIPRSLYAELGLTPWPDSVLISINGQKTVRATQPDGSIQEYSVSIPQGAQIALEQSVGKKVPIEYQIGGELKKTMVEVTPDLTDAWFMQVQFVETFLTFHEKALMQTNNPITAMVWGVKRTWYFLINTYITIKQMLFTQQIGVEHLSGPVGIVKIGTQVAESGLPQLIYFLAFLSANFAVVNFLPFPIVDGGHFMFLLIEKIKGKPLSVRVQMVTQVIGLAMILGAFAFLTLQDIILWNQR